MVDWRQALEQKWTALRFGEMKVETKDDQHVYEVQVYLNGPDPKAVRVELYADGKQSSLIGKISYRYWRRPWRNTSRYAVG
nr:hypothetical protein [Desulfobulbaceae bacterium]